MNEMVQQRPAPPAVPGSFNNPVPNTLAELAKVPIGEPLKTLEEVVLFGRALAFAGLLPDSLMDKRTGTVKVADVVLLLCMGAELELSPMQAISGIYVVKGRPMLSAQLWGTRVRKFGHKLEIRQTKNKHGRPESAICTITRGDDGTVHEEEFTIYDALNAGLIQRLGDEGQVIARGYDGKNPTPWEQYTKTMLRNRAISHCSRFACPEVIYGTMGIQGEEYDELADEEGFGQDRFVAGKSIEGTPQQKEDMAAELAALAERMAGQGVPKSIAEVMEPLRGDDADEAKAFLEKLNRGATEQRNGVDTVVEPGQAVRDHTNTRLCDVCGFRFFPNEHTLDDHEPVWVTEPEDA